MSTERPRKVYTLTNEGHNLLNFTEDSLTFICRRIGATDMFKGNQAEQGMTHAVLRPLLRNIESPRALV